MCYAETCARPVPDGFVKIEILAIGHIEMPMSSLALPTLTARLPKRRLAQMVANLLILIGAHLIAVQIRLRIPWGLALGPEYDGQPIGMYVVFIGAVGLAYGMAWIVARAERPRRILAPHKQFRVLIVAIGLAWAGALVFLPDLSQLQMAYFTVTAVVLGVCVIVWPGRINRGATGRDVYTALIRLWAARPLLGLWLRLNIQSRYSQTVLGILWIVLLPLATSGVLALAFSQFLRVKSDVPFIVFFFCALLMWGLFNQGIFNGMGAIRARMELIRQVAFPREVLVLLAIGEALIDLFFTLIAMIIVNALHGIWPNAQWVYLPALIGILLCLTLGLMFFLSSLSLLVRDIPQLVSVVMQLLFYLTPILYPVDAIPERFRFIVLLNPVGLVIQAVREVVIYARPPDPLTLYYPTVVGLTLLYMGYAFFKANEERFADLT